MTIDNDSGLNALNVISHIGRILLMSGKPADVIAEVLSRLGNAFGIDRVYIFKNRIDADTGKVFTNYCYEWCSEGIEPQIESAITQDVSYDEFVPRWYDFMIKGDYIMGNVKDFPKDERWILEPQNIKSLITVPIFFQDVFWGFVGFDFCKSERSWSEHEIQTLTVASVMISNYVIRTKMQEELQENERRWYQALEGTGEGVIDYEVKTNKIFISEGGKKILGVSFNSEILLDEAEDNAILGSLSVKNFFKDIISHGSLAEYEFSMGDDSNARWFSAKGVVVSWGVFGEPLRIIGTFSDITNRRIFDNKLKDALMAAEAANKAKSSFLATMSHEIRTPLNGIMGFLRLLDEHVMDDTGAEYLRIINNSAGTLLNIINSILDISKVENGSMVLENGDCSLGNELEAVARLFSASAFEKKLYLRSFIDPKIPEIIKCDQLRIRQVLSNLLNNALKFTPDSGQIYLNVFVANKRKNSVDITFSVKDTGIGIQEDFHKNIFKPFTQADSSVSRKFGGSGLGLTIAYKFVELMGGRIELNSAVGEGSNFYFTLTFPIVKDIDITFKEGRTVAYVEYPNCRWGFGKSLTSIGFRSIFYDSIEDLVESDMSSYYAIVFSVFYTNQLVISDIEFLRSKNKTIPIILVTYPIDVSIFDVLNTYNVKTKIRPSCLIKFYNMADNVQNSKLPVESERTGAEMPTFSGRVLVAEDNAINSKLISIILEKYGLDVSAVVNGKEALDLLAKEDFDIVLMDINMPVMDGITATKEFRKDEKFKGNRRRMPIIALTANVMKDDADEFIAAGMDAVLNKPIMLRAIEDVFRKFLFN